MNKGRSRARARARALSLSLSLSLARARARARSLYHVLRRRTAGKMRGEAGGAKGLHSRNVKDGQTHAKVPELARVRVGAGWGVQDPSGFRSRVQGARSWGWRLGARGLLAWLPRRVRMARARCPDSVVHRAPLSPPSCLLAQAHARARNRTPAVCSSTTHTLSLTHTHTHSHTPTHTLDRYTPCCAGRHASTCKDRDSP